MKTANSIFKIFLVALLLAVQVHFAYAQTAALLPVAPQQFFDKNGNPVTSGSVGYYIPGTSTPKMVWQDDSQTTPWTNPITLNAGGWPPNNKGIYGNGTYRQIIKDKYNNIISDQPTSATGSGGGSGTSVGDGNSVGTILTWSGMIAPNQYQFAYGQALSRSSFPELYQAITLQTPVTCVGGNTTLTGLSDTSNIPIGANVEGNCIVSGTTVLSKTINTVTLSIAANISTSITATFFPYGNGNGLTTFNVPDLRGKVIPGRTNMGGVVTSNLTSSYYGSSPDAVGANGGTQSKLISLTQMPSHRHSVFLNDPGHLHAARVDGAFSVGSGTGLTPVGSGTQTMGAGKATSVGTTDPNTTGITVRDTSGGGGVADQTALTGGSDPISVISPSITMNYIIKVTPDTSISGLFGVASIGGMQGIIACGTGITCAGNTISAVAPITGITVNSTTVAGATNGYYLYSEGGILKNGPPSLRSVIDCGADPTGATDSTAAINNCITTYKYVFAPSGTYKISSPGIQLTTNYQGLIGVGSTATKFIYNDTTGCAFNMAAGSGLILEGFTIDRTSGVPVSGCGIGGPGPINDTSFTNIHISNQYNGFNLPPCYYCTISTIKSDNNYNDGIRFTATNAHPVSQYFASAMSASFNNGWGFKIDTTGMTQGVTFLAWDMVNTFANASGALSAVTASNAPINDLKLSNVNFSSDNATLVQLQTYGIHNSIIGGLIEVSGSVASGRGSAIPASGLGHGISLKNNVEINLSGLFIRTNSQHGIVSDGTDTNVTISGSMLSANGTATVNTYDGINIASGTITPNISGVNSGWGGTIQRYGINSADADTLVTNSIFNGVTAGCNFPAGALGGTNTGFNCAVTAVLAGTQFNGGTSGSTVVRPNAIASGVLTLPAATDTLVGKATIDTLTNKTYDTAGTGNSFSINGLAATANTGMGAVVRATSPTISGAQLSGAANVLSGGSFSINSGSTFAINNGGFTFGGSVAPQMNFQPSSGSTQVGQINQTGDVFSLARFGGPNYLSVDISTGVISGISAVAATSATTGTIKSSGGIGAAGAIWAGTYINATPTLVANLPTCNAALDGARAFVTNNNTAAAWQGAVTTGGTNHTPVYCDGSSSTWKQG